MLPSVFGNDLEKIVLGVQAAMERKVPLSVRWNYNDSKHDGFNATCPAKDMSCYFLPITNCQPNTRKMDNDPIRLINKYVDDFQSIYKYMTRQQQWLRKLVYDMVKPMESKLTVPCSVVHVRRRADIALHGSQARTSFPISDYVNLLPSRTDTVLLLTNDANVIDEALEFHPDISWVYFDHKQRSTSGGLEDSKQELVTILSILKLVPRCSTLIHSRSTHALSRVMGPHVTLLQVVDNSNGTNILHANNSTIIPVPYT